MFLLGLSVFAMATVYASWAAVKSAISRRMASKVMAAVSDVDVDPYIIYLILVEEEDGERICFLGGNSSSGIKKYRGSNSSDGGNIRDGVKIAGGVIGSGDEIEFSEELKEWPFTAMKLGIIDETKFKLRSKEGYGARWRIAIDRLLSSSTLVMLMKNSWFVKFLPAKVGDLEGMFKKAKGGRTHFIFRVRRLIVGFISNCQRPGHFVRDCRSPAIPAAPVNAVDARPNQRACYECGDPNHL
ncbi:retrovirus-related pol polyprotein from transposon TNT 1-94 [Tanacetum coccineum]